MNANKEENWIVCIFKCFLAYRESRNEMIFDAKTEACDSGLQKLLLTPDSGYFVTFCWHFISFCMLEKALTVLKTNK